MAISTNAILSIEQTLAKVLETAWQNEFTTLKVQLSTLVEMGKYDQAYDLAYKLDLAPLFSKHREYIKYATYSAMLFGASRVTPRVERSGFAKGSWGDTVATVLDTFRIQIELLVGEQARKALLKELDQLVDTKRQEQISSVEKANPWRDKEGRYTDEANDADGVPDFSVAQPFKDWFEGSKVVGDDGKPKVVFHGTNQDIREFTLNPHPYLPKGNAIYFSPTSEGANKASLWRGESGANVLPVYLSIKNPKYVDDSFTHALSADVVAQYKREGYDGLIGTRFGEITEYVVFDPKQIRNSIGVKKAEDRILKPFQTFDRTGLGYLQLVSQLHTSRVSAFGFTAEADIVGLTEYSITEQLDNRVCAVCEAMHGRTFRVEDARNALNTILRVKDPNELKVLQAWPRQDAQTVEMIKGMSDSDLISRNWHLPPYHPWCRGLLVRVGKVPKLKPKELGAVETPEVPEEITQDNFNNLGVEISNGNVEAWKATVGSTPEEFLSRVSGKSTTEFNHDLYRTSNEPSLRAAGISRFRIEDNGRVTVGGLVPGGRLKHWEIELDLLDRKWRFKKFTSKDYDHLKALWENWSDYFTELGLTLAGD